MEIPYLKGITVSKYYPTKPNGKGNGNFTSSKLLDDISITMTHISITKQVLRLIPALSPQVNARERRNFNSNLEKHEQD